VKETALSRPGLPVEAASFLACVATILELPETDVPDLAGNGAPSEDWNVLAWLGALGIGLVPVADPPSFAWPGPWIAQVRAPGGDRRSVVMFGRTPSGVVWDPVGGETVSPEQIEQGFLLAAEDIAHGLPRREDASAQTGSLEQIWVSAGAGQEGRALECAALLPGVGLEGDRYATGQGTFPSGRTGSALTLIEAEVCESFEPPLTPEEHRRNLVTRGVRLNGWVGREFTIGTVRCRGIRLCEPCAAMQRYADRAILRPLVHRGGLRADILAPGRIELGDEIALVAGG